MLCLALCFSLSSKAQDTTVETYTTGNVINPGSWTGAVYGTDPGDCCSNPGGSQPLYEVNQNIIKWSYGYATVSQQIALQQALSFGGTGLKLHGYNWSWWVRNDNGGEIQGGTDTLNYWVDTTSSNGTLLDRMSGTYNTRFGPTVFSGTRTYTNPFGIQDLGNLSVNFSGSDSGFWAGTYGPEVGNVNIRLIYSVDQCLADPLSSTSCPGYEQAYFNLQCTNNPLYSTNCPGYFSAWLNQVCSVSPLADLLCPGYQEAYFQQQCTANPLYDPNCSGYGAAMAAKLESEKKTEEKTSPIVQPQETSIASSIEDSTKEPTRTDVGGIETTTTGEIVVPDGIPQVVKESTVEKEKKSAGAPTSLIMSMLRNEREKEQRLALDVAAKAEKESMSENANPSDGIGYGLDPRTAGVGLQIPGSIQNNNQQQETQNQENTKLNSNIATMDNGEQRQQNISNESNKQPQGLRRKGEPNDMDSNTTIAALVQSPVGFESYLKGNLTDGQMYAPKEIYKNQRVVDNARLERILNLQSDIRYEELVNQQYELAK